MCKERVRTTIVYRSGLGPHDFPEKNGPELEAIPNQLRTSECVDDCT